MDADGELRSTTGEKLEEALGKEAEIESREGKPRASRVRRSRFRLASAEKMAKSRGNSVSPDLVVEEFGADSLRVYEMFMGPLEQVKPWQTSGIQGVRRFLDRVDTHCAAAHSTMAKWTTRRRSSSIAPCKKVGDDIEGLRLNTAVSAMMKLVNHLNGLERPPREAVEKLVLCLSPFAPHLAEELWESRGHPPSVANAPWPSYDPALCAWTTSSRSASK